MNTQIERNDLLRLSLKAYSLSAMLSNGAMGIVAGNFLKKRYFCPMVISGMKDLEDMVEIGKVKKELLELVDLIDKLEGREISNDE